MARMKKGLGKQHGTVTGVQRNDRDKTPRARGPNLFSQRVVATLVGMDFEASLSDELRRKYLNEKAQIILVRKCDRGGKNKHDSRLNGADDFRAREIVKLQTKYRELMQQVELDDTHSDSDLSDSANNPNSMN